MDLRIIPPEGMVDAHVTLPLSKSMSNRSLIMSALTGAMDVNCQVAVCDDTMAMVRALTHDAQGVVDIGAAGTAMRFLTAYYSALPGSSVTMDGSERMRKRPIGPLVDALRACGADIEYLGEEGFPPLKIQGRRLHGGNYSIDATISSQFISAMLMVAPTFDSPTTIHLDGEASSLPYIDMTIGMMRNRGIDVERYNDDIDIKPGKYTELQQSDIEHDWSAASYWYAITALSGGFVTLDDMTLPSLQGDSNIAKLMEMLGAVTECEDGNTNLAASPEVFSRFDVDMSQTPDLVQTVVVVCGMIGVPFTITGVSSLRIKETDRLAALQTEMAKLGVMMTIDGDNTIKWNGERRPINVMPVIDTYDDHRMAMAFAPAALYIPGMVIRNVEVVSKSYPKFWSDLQAAGFLFAKVENQTSNETE